ANFRTLLPLLVENLLAAEKLDEGLLRAIALLEASADNTKIPAIAIAETRADGVEKLVDRFPRHQVRRGAPAGRKVSALAHSDHLLHVRPHRLGLNNGGFNSLFDDQRSDQVAEQRPPMRGVPAQFPSCFSVTHFPIP